MLMPNKLIQIKPSILNTEKIMGYLNKKEFYTLCDAVGKV